MRKRAFLIPLIAGVLLLAAGFLCFTQVCGVKDRIYDLYQFSFTDDMIRETVMKDSGEEAFRQDFDGAVLSLARTGGTEQAEGDSGEAAGAVPAASPYQSVFSDFGAVGRLRTAFRLQSWLLGAGALLCLAAVLMLLLIRMLTGA